MKQKKGLALELQQCESCYSIPYGTDLYRSTASGANRRGGVAHDDDLAVRQACDGGQPVTKLQASHIQERFVLKVKDAHTLHRMQRSSINGVRASGAS